jgi:hypothetical protein
MKAPLQNILHTCCFCVTRDAVKAAALRSHISMERANQTGLYSGRTCSCVTVFPIRLLLSLTWNTAVNIRCPCLNLVVFRAKRITAPISLNVGTTGTLADSFTSLYPQSKSPWYQQKWRASLSDRLGAWEKRNISCSRRESNGDLSVLQPVGYSLYGRNYPDS